MIGLQTLHLGPTSCFFHLRCNWLRVILYLHRVPDPIQDFFDYPHFLSGIVVLLHLGPKQRVVPVLNHVLSSDVPHFLGDHRPLFTLLENKGDEGEVLTGCPLRFELDGIQMVHPALPALLGSPEESPV